MMTLGFLGNPNLEKKEKTFRLEEISCPKCANKIE
jgi:hypothetical protein